MVGVAGSGGAPATEIRILLPYGNPQARIPTPIRYEGTHAYGYARTKDPEDVNSRHPSTTDRTGLSDLLWRGGPMGVRAPSDKTFRPWSRRR